MPPPGVNQNERSGRVGIVPAHQEQPAVAIQKQHSGAVALDAQFCPSVGRITSHALQGGAAQEPLRR